MAVTIMIRNGAKIALLEATITNLKRELATSTDLRFRWISEGARQLRAMRHDLDVANSARLELARDVLRHLHTIGDLDRACVARDKTIADLIEAWPTPDQLDAYHEGRLMKAKLQRRRDAARRRLDTAERALEDHTVSLDHFEANLIEPRMHVRGLPDWPQDPMERPATNGKSFVSPAPFTIGAVLAHKAQRTPALDA